MKILVCGPESSGTKAVAAALTLAGGDVKHLSFPYGGDRPFDPSWPEWNPQDYDAIVVVVRESYSTTMSQIECDHADTRDRARRLIAMGLRRIFEPADETDTPYYTVTLESLVNNRQVVDQLLNDLSLDPQKVANDYFRDANAKWYGGPVFHDQRTVEERV